MSTNKPIKKHGNIFTTDCDVIVNTVNCQGVMGAGIAKEFKIRYPEMYEEYRLNCERGLVRIGSLSLHQVQDRRVLNFPTKIQWRYPSKVQYLEEGLAEFVNSYKDHHIESIAFPMLGASKGGLSEEVSLEIMERHLSQCDIKVEIWSYDPIAKDDLYPSFSKLFGVYSDTEIKSLSGISTKTVQKMRAELEKPHVNSLNSLARTRGIGDVSLNKLMRWVNTHIDEEPQVQLSLFP